MPEKRTPYFKIFVTTMFVPAIFGGVFVWTLYPKTSRSWGSNPANYTELRYAGLGLSFTESLYGVMPISVSVPLSQSYDDDSLMDVRQVIQLRKERINGNPRHRKCTFEYIDDAGRKRADGSGHVDFDCRQGIVSVCLYRINEATYFKADGSVGSTIIGGSGRETWWNDDGSPQLEAVFENGFWGSTTFYDENGDVKKYIEYEEGKYVDWKRCEE